MRVGAALPGIAVTVCGAVFAACGGGGGDEVPPSPEPEPDDASYVAQICDALLELQDEVNDVREAADGPGTPPSATDLYLPPLEHYLSSLRRADPPGDVLDYHDAVVAATEAAIAKVREEGDLAAFESAPGPEPPPLEVRTRLNAAAAANPDCQEAGFDFG